jgi:DNA processing protein
MQLALTRDRGPIAAPISPRLEMGAYEALWLRDGAWFTNIAEKFAGQPDALPSDFISPTEAGRCASEVLRIFKEEGIDRFGIRINHAGDYPEKLRHAQHPVELLYYRGVWELTETRCVAVVGARKPSDDGIARARKLAKALAERGFTVVSGLATGIDRATHEATLEAGGPTIGIIGTPLSDCYPKENKALQDRIAQEYLLISQVPVLRYRQQKPPQNRFFFPERNITMSALTEATIIVEAGDTSGTLTQARAALHQGRKLFILNSCFERPGLTWPERFEKQGAIRVREFDDLWSALG